MIRSSDLGVGYARDLRKRPQILAAGINFSIGGSGAWRMKSRTSFIGKNRKEALDGIVDDIYYGNLQIPSKNRKCAIIAYKNRLSTYRCATLILLSFQKKS